jgi:predicted nucleic acid-binding protein
MPMVVDASMALAWHFDDEATPVTEALFARTVDEAIHVPRHWFVEVSNGLLVGEIRKRTTLAQTAAFIERLSIMSIEVDAFGGFGTFERLLPLARGHRLTSYDAMYLELAGRLGLSLATLDAELAAAARNVGVETLGR